MQHIMRDILTVLAAPSLLIGALQKPSLPHTPPRHHARLHLANRDLPPLLEPQASTSTNHLTTTILPSHHSSGHTLQSSSASPDLRLPPGRNHRNLPRTDRISLLTPPQPHLRPYRPQQRLRLEYCCHNAPSCFPLGHPRSTDSFNTA